MLKEEIKKLLQESLNHAGIDADTIIVDYPVDAKHGDYSTNVALVAAKKAGKNPRELAEEIAEKLKNADIFEKVEIAGPGFINFWVKDAYLVIKANSFDKNSTVKTSLTGEKIMVEFAHPNTHKAFHIGHLRNITTGESVIRLMEAAGAHVIRVNYQGDVGMHIAKAIYGLTMMIGDENVETKALTFENSSNDKEKILNIVKALGSRDINVRIALLGEAYAYGSKLFEEKGVATAAIKEINKSIYNHEWGIYKPYEEVYKITRQWSLDYFELIYKRLYTQYDRLYFESEVYESGKKIVEEGLEKGIFEKSEGAIIFPGSKYKLHDRVFITSEGNPTYEGKEMGLGPLQFFGEYKPDRIMHVVGPEQAGYFQVVFEALAQLFPEMRGKELHLAYGWVKLKHGKMSSRTGNVVWGEWLLDEAKKKILESYDITDTVAEEVAVGAVKYSFLKVGLNQEIAFDLEESISLQGNSGPYLQYTFARTQSVLVKSQISNLKSQKQAEDFSLESEERELLRLLVRFPEIVEEAAVLYAPQVLCTYLFDLAQAFNLFYQKHQILKADADARDFRLQLTEQTGSVLKKGLNLLGIKSPEKM